MSDPASLIQATLKKVTKSEEPKGLALEWSDGFKGTIPFALLRLECPCALCKGERLPFDPDPLRLPTARSLSEQAMVPRDLFKVGGYALGIRWADGHDTGIYTFDYLRNLIPRTQIP